jgi:hypothetical protein
MAANMKHIVDFNTFVNETIETAKSQLDKAMRKQQKYDKKAESSAYDIQFKQDKLEFEKKKESLKVKIGAESDPVKKARFKVELDGLEKDWKQTSSKYKERLKVMR